MADFGYFSDTDDSAVEELISQAKELSVLEQVASINGSGFTDSVLPDDLESRFRLLKSLPAASANPKASSKKRLGHSKTGSGCPVGRENGSSSSSSEEKMVFSGNKRNPNGEGGALKNSRSEGNSLKSSVNDRAEGVFSSDEETRIFSGNKRNPDERTGLKKNSRSGYAPDLKKKSSGKCIEEFDDYDSEDFLDPGKVCSNSSNSSKDDEFFSPSKQIPCKKKGLKHKSRSKHCPGSSSNSSAENVSSPSDPNPEKKRKQKPKPNSSNSWLDLLSPARTIGCLWRSPKKASKEKTMKAKAFGNESKNVDFDEFLSDLSAFPVEEQRKILKKAMKEQQKMRKEAAKIVKMARQASSRMGYDD